jgi:hypothetical protein
MKKVACWLKDPCGNTYSPNVASIAQFNGDGTAQLVETAVSWLIEELQCASSKLLRIAREKNAGIVFPDDVSHNSTCKMTCSAGYHGSSVTALCDAGEWENTSITCTPDARNLNSPSPTPAPVDCKYTDWSVQSACPENCDGSELRRSERTIDIDAANGGTACDTTRLTKLEWCDPEACEESTADSDNVSEPRNNASGPRTTVTKPEVKSTEVREESSGRIEWVSLGQ